MATNKNINSFFSNGIVEVTANFSGITGIKPGNSHIMFPVELDFNEFYKKLEYYSLETYNALNFNDLGIKVFLETGLHLSEINICAGITRRLKKITGRDSFLMYGRQIGLILNDSGKPEIKEIAVFLSELENNKKNSSMIKDSILYIKSCYPEANVYLETKFNRIRNIRKVAEFITASTPVLAVGQFVLTETNFNKFWSDRKEFYFQVWQRTVPENGPEIAHTYSDWLYLSKQVATVVITQAFPKKNKVIKIKKQKCTDFDGTNFNMYHINDVIVITSKGEIWLNNNYLVPYINTNSAIKNIEHIINVFQKDTRLISQWKNLLDALRILRDQRQLINFIYKS